MFLKSTTETVIVRETVMMRRNHGDGIARDHGHVPGHGQDLDRAQRRARPLLGVGDFSGLRARRSRADADVGGIPAESCRYSSRPNHGNGALGVAQGMPVYTPWRSIGAAAARWSASGIPSIGEAASVLPTKPLPNARPTVQI